MKQLDRYLTEARPVLDHSLSIKLPWRHIVAICSLLYIFFLLDIKRRLKKLCRMQARSLIWKSELELSRKNGQSRFAAIVIFNIDHFTTSKLGLFSIISKIFAFLSVTVVKFVIDGGYFLKYACINFQIP